MSPGLLINISFYAKNAIEDPIFVGIYSLGETLKKNLKKYFFGFLVQVLQLRRCIFSSPFDMNFPANLTSLCYFFL